MQNLINLTKYITGEWTVLLTPYFSGLYIIENVNMPFVFNPQQPSKPTDKTDKPSFDFGIDTSKSKPADKPDKPSFDFGTETSTPKTADKSGKPSVDFGIGASASKPSDKKNAGTKKTGSAPRSESVKTKQNKDGSKPVDSSGRGKRTSAKKNPFQDKKVMIFAGVGIAVLLLIIVAIASNSGKGDSAPQQTVRKKLTPEEARRERLRKLEAKYDAQYAAQQSGPKTEKQKLMAEAESKLRQGDYRGAADIYVKVHQLDPTDGYPVTQLINIYRNKLHDRAQVEKWEQVNNDIAKGSLDQLQKKSEEKYNKNK